MEQTKKKEKDLVFVNISTTRGLLHMDLGIN